MCKKSVQALFALSVVAFALSGCDKVEVPAAAPLPISGGGLPDITGAKASERVTFIGSTGAEPYWASAISLGPTRVLLTLSDRMSSNVGNWRLYRIASPDLGLIAATQVPGATLVVLTTETQENVEYAVKVISVTSLDDGILIDPTRNTASFFGIPPYDAEGPTLVSAACTSDTTVLLSFSEPLDDEAADPINFSITPALVIVGAELTT